MQEPGPGQVFHPVTLYTGGYFWSVSTCFIQSSQHHLRKKSVVTQPISSGSCLESFLPLRALLALRTSLPQHWLPRTVNFSSPGKVMGFLRAGPKPQVFSSNMIQLCKRNEICSARWEFGFAHCLSADLNKNKAAAQLTICSDTEHWMPMFFQHTTRPPGLKVKILNLHPDFITNHWQDP